MKPRREWPRILVPQRMFDLVVFIAMAHGYHERSLHRFLYITLKRAYPDEFQKFATYFDVEDLEDPPDES